MPTVNTIVVALAAALAFWAGAVTAQRKCAADKYAAEAAAQKALAHAIEREAILAREIAEAAVRRAEDDAAVLADMQTVIDALAKEEEAAPAAGADVKENPAQTKQLVSADCRIDGALAARMRELDAHNPKARTSSRPAGIR